MPISITQENLEREVARSSKPVILDIYASWCGPCQQMAPHIEDLERELSDQYTFAKLNVDEARELSIKYGVSSVPTLLFIKDNKVIGKEIGYMGKDDIREKIEEYFGK